MEVVRQRERAKTGNQAARAFDWDKRLAQDGAVSTSSTGTRRSG